MRGKSWRWVRRAAIAYAVVGVLLGVLWVTRFTQPKLLITRVGWVAQFVVLWPVMIPLFLGPVDFDR